VIVTGAPATGKTTIARRLACDLGLPFINKDDIKEILFDTLGWKDRAWSQQMGIAAYALLYRFLETLLATEHSAVVESNFDPIAATERMRQLQEEYPFSAVQVLCYTDGGVLTRRFIERDDNGERHPGHVDAEALRDIAPVLQRGRLDPLDLAGLVVEVDTTDFHQVRYESLLERVRDALRSP
jgi:predicted kinase